MQPIQKIMREKSLCEVSVLGVALTADNALVVFQDKYRNEFMPLNVSPFDMDALVRGVEGDGDDMAAVWLSECINRLNPLYAKLMTDSLHVELNFRHAKPKRNRRISIGDGLIIARRLSLPLLVSKNAFDSTRGELDRLSDLGIFGDNFLYLGSYASHCRGAAVHLA